VEHAMLPCCPCVPLSLSLSLSLCAHASTGAVTCNRFLLLCCAVLCCAHPMLSPDTPSPLHNTSPVATLHHIPGRHRPCHHCYQALPSLTPVMSWQCCTSERMCRRSVWRLVHRSCRCATGSCAASDCRWQSWSAALQQHAARCQTCPQSMLKWHSSRQSCCW
jgi:hypothetical protein